MENTNEKSIAQQLIESGEVITFQEFLDLYYDGNVDEYIQEMTIWESDLSNSLREFDLYVQEAINPTDYIKSGFNNYIFRKKDNNNDNSLSNKYATDTKFSKKQSQIGNAINGGMGTGKAAKSVIDVGKDININRRNLMGVKPSGIMNPYNNGLEPISKSMSHANLVADNFENAKTVANGVVSGLGTVMGAANGISAVVAAIRSIQLAIGSKTEFDKESLAAAFEEVKLKIANTAMIKPSASEIDGITDSIAHYHANTPQPVDYNNNTSNVSEAFTEATDPNNTIPDGQRKRRWDDDLHLNTNIEDVAGIIKSNLGYNKALKDTPIAQISSFHNIIYVPSHKNVLEGTESLIKSLENFVALLERIANMKSTNQADVKKFLIAIDSVENSNEYTEFHNATNSLNSITKAVHEITKNMTANLFKENGMIEYNINNVFQMIDDWRDRCFRISDQLEDFINKFANKTRSIVDDNYLTQNGLNIFLGIIKNVDNSISNIKIYVKDSLVKGISLKTKHSKEGALTQNNAAAQYMRQGGSAQERAQAVFRQYQQNTAQKQMYNQAGLADDGSDPQLLQTAQQGLNEIEQSMQNMMSYMKQPLDERTSQTGEEILQQNEDGIGKVRSYVQNVEQMKQKKSQVDNNTNQQQNPQSTQQTTGSNGNNQTSTQPTTAEAMIDNASNNIAQQPNT